MARREYARLSSHLWEDDDFTALEPLAQWLYLHLLTHPSLSFCGVVDWRPNRVAAVARHLEPADVEAAMSLLQAARFVVVDEDTEEALIRSFVRHDGLLGNPNVTTAMAREFRGIASRFIRGVFVHELRRLHSDQPELRGWVKAQAVLERAAIDPYPEGVEEADPAPFLGPSTKGIRSPSPSPSPSPFVSPSDEEEEPLVEEVPHYGHRTPDSSSRAPDDGLPPPASHGGRVRGREAAAEPPLRCPRHLEQPAEGACGPCGDARRAHEAWSRDREQRRRDAGPVVGQDCPEHLGESAGRCGQCAAVAAPPPRSLRALRDSHRDAS